MLEAALVARTTSAATSAVCSSHCSTRVECLSMSLRFCATASLQSSIWSSVRRFAASASISSGSGTPIRAHRSVLLLQTCARRALVVALGRRLGAAPGMPRTPSRRQTCLE